MSADSGIIWGKRVLWGGVILIVLIAVGAGVKWSYGPIASHKYTSNVHDIAYSIVCINSHQYTHITDEGTPGQDGKADIPRASTYSLDLDSDGKPVHCGL